MSDIQKLDEQYIAHTYKRFPIELVSGNGAILTDADGRDYIDMGSGIGVSAFGHGDELWQKAVLDQISRLAHASNLYYTSPCALLAQLLNEKTGGFARKVFFANSGAEANECAIKAARKYASDKGQKDRFTIVTLKNSFHGRTLTTLAATGQDRFHALFRPLTPGFCYAAANDIEDVKRVSLENRACAVMIECVQGEGGVIALERDYVRELRKFTAENDMLLIVDEVQTGNGRTGSLYAYMQYGITPDIVTTAKGLAGGLPLGACMLGEKVEEVFSYGDHGSTFGGNPVCCAAALSILSRIDEPLLNEVKKKGEYVKKTLAGASGIDSVTGMGLMIGIKTAKPVAEVVEYCQKHGVLPLTAKDKLRLLPPLNISPELLEKAVSVIAEGARL